MDDMLRYVDENLRSALPLGLFKNLNENGNGNLNDELKYYVYSVHI